MAIEIFHRIGLSEAFRISHVIVAVMWMGLLWFFNFVQTPAYAEMEAGSRNDAFYGVIVPISFSAAASTAIPVVSTVTCARA